VVVVAQAAAAAEVAAGDAAGVVAAAGVELVIVTNDRVGLGWRPDLAAGIFDHLERIDLLEIIADDFFDAPARDIRALKTLASQIPVVLHGIGLGLASASPVEKPLLEEMARLVGQVQPESWSEHLAFVRAGGLETGHLAAPPRTPETVEGSAENLFLAAKSVGSKPLMENIATILDPPASTFSESSWISSILHSANCDLLLDLHNLFANGLNHGYNPYDFLRQIPLSRVKAIHIAGGKFVSAADGRVRLLDDHLHDVPDPVFALLEEVAAISPHPLTVILERDGAYPPMAELLHQIARARSSLARGRARRLACLESRI
jgi:uncharacterized protein (UPF0276 family)